jgi:hypothetical protein
MRGEIASLKEQVRHGDVHVQELNSAFQRNSASTCEQFIKIETQFGTTETVINELRVDDLRSRSIVWYKMFNQPYPDMFYEIKIPHDLEKCL